MSIVRRKAEEIFRREHPRLYDNYCPYYTPPQLSGLWPCDQQKYIERAEAELGLRRSHADSIR